MKGIFKQGLKYGYKGKFCQMVDYKENPLGEYIFNEIEKIKEFISVNIKSAEDKDLYKRVVDSEEFFHFASLEYVEVDFNKVKSLIILNNPIDFANTVSKEINDVRNCVRKNLMEEELVFSC